MNEVDESANQTSTIPSRRGAARNRRISQRQCSNVFALLSQGQISEFKEAFAMIDRDGDGLIQREDLLDILASLGESPTDQQVEAMLEEASGNINLTMFLTMMGEKIGSSGSIGGGLSRNGSSSQTEDEALLAAAFKDLADESGLVQLDYLKELLCSMGDKLSLEQFDSFVKGFTVSKSTDSGTLKYFDYKKFLIEIKC